MLQFIGAKFFYNLDKKTLAQMETELKEKPPRFLRCAENECLLRVEKHSGNMVQLSNQSTVR